MVAAVAAAAAVPVSGAQLLWLLAAPAAEGRRSGLADEGGRALPASNWHTDLSNYLFAHSTGYTVGVLC
jgi:hypothetical protein